MGFIKFERLQWASHIVRMDNYKIPKKYWMAIPQKEPYGKTTTEMGKHQKELPVAAEYQRIQEKRELLKRPGIDVSCRANEEEEEE